MAKSGNDIINSTTGAFTAELLTLPICTIKTYYQNTTNKTIRQCVSEIYKSGGIKPFYNASVPAVTSQVFSSMSKYTIFNYLEKKQYKYTNRLTNGLVSGIMTSLITHPIDFFKIHYQMNKHATPEIKKHGIGVLYRGYSKSFMKVCIGSSLFFPIHFTVKDHINSYNIPYSTTLAAGITAVISTMIMHPFDYLKTKHIYNTTLYHGYNPLKYYKGLSINLLRIVPHYVIMMTVIDYMETKFNK